MRLLLSPLVSLRVSCLFVCSGGPLARPPRLALFSPSLPSLSARPCSLASSCPCLPLVVSSPPTWNCSNLWTDLPWYTISTISRSCMFFSVINCIVGQCPSLRLIQSYRHSSNCQTLTIDSAGLLCKEYLHKKKKKNHPLVTLPYTSMG